MQSESHSNAPPWARTMLAEGRVARMATADAEGRPSVVAVCYALDGDVLYSPIDGKPKSARKLRRVSDLEANSHVALIVDQWDEDWRRLAWVSMRGRGSLLEAPAEGEPDPSHEPERRAAIRSLRVKYPQYGRPSDGRTGGAPLDDAAIVIRVAIDTVRWWRFAPGSGG